MLGNKQPCLIKPIPITKDVDWNKKSKFSICEIYWIWKSSVIPKETILKKIKSRKGAE